MIAERHTLAAERGTANMAEQLAAAQLENARLAAAVAQHNLDEREVRIPRSHSLHLRLLHDALCKARVAAGGLQ